ncbi:MAG: TlpA disulfide reductase family protein [Bacteroidota bacterium]
MYRTPYMIRQFTIVILSIMAFSLLSAQESTYQLKGTLTSCSLDSVRLFRLDGGILFPISSAPLRAENGMFTFEFSGLDIPKGFYLLGGGESNNTRMLLIDQEEAITLTGECKTLTNASIWNSPVNTAMAKMSKRQLYLQSQANQEVNTYRVALQRQAGIKEAEASIQAIDKQKLAYLDSVKTSHPFLSKVLALQTYTSFQHSQKAYDSEVIYFAKEYFQYADLSDPAYNLIPQVHDEFRRYSGTLGQIGLPADAITQYLSDHLANIPTGSAAHKAALSGAVMGLKESSIDAFTYFGNAYLESYAAWNPAFTQMLEKELNAVKSRIVGAEAPEISLPTPEGGLKKLSDFRGQYVMIDFWASWCRPCRMENPKVLNVYNKFKDKGFEILGVSLDRDGTSWKKAIEKDGLVWYHVSDLKYFQSEAALTYGVQAIPYTVLVDPEGKIVATNLRSQRLEQVLRELLGEPSE